VSTHSSQMWILSGPSISTRAGSKGLTQKEQRGAAVCSRLVCHHCPPARCAPTSATRTGSQEARRFKPWEGDTKRRIAPGETIIQRFSNVLLITWGRLQFVANSNEPTA